MQGNGWMFEFDATSPWIFNRYFSFAFRRNYISNIFSAIEIVLRLPRLVSSSSLLCAGTRAWTTFPAWNFLRLTRPPLLRVKHVRLSRNYSTAPLRMNTNGIFYCPSPLPLFVLVLLTYAFNLTSLFVKPYSLFFIFYKCKKKPWAAYIVFFFFFFFLTSRKLAGS